MPDTAFRIRLAAPAIVGIGLLVAIAATLGPLTPPAGAPPGGSLTIHLPGAVRATVFVLLALSAIVFIGILRTEQRREPQMMPIPEQRRLPAWVAALLSFSSVLLFGVVVYLLLARLSGGEGQPLGAGITAIADLLDFLSQQRKPSTSVPFYNAAIAVIAVVAAAAALGVMLLLAFAERIEKWLQRGMTADRPMPLDAAIEESLDDLRREPDARAAIIRVYRRFERALSEARAPRSPWQTPSEFMRAALARLPVPRPPVERLTSLFELARFSDRDLGTDARDAACDCLDEIKTKLAELPTAAAAREAFLESAGPPVIDERAAHRDAVAAATAAMEGRHAP